MKIFNIVVTTKKTIYNNELIAFLSGMFWICIIMWFIILYRIYG